MITRITIGTTIEKTRANYNTKNKKHMKYIINNIRKNNNKNNNKNEKDGKISTSNNDNSHKKN